MRTHATKQPKPTERNSNHPTAIKTTPTSRRSLATGSTMLQRKPGCPCGGGCPRCQELLQTKLKIGEPGDKYEREADRIADEVMRMPETSVRRQIEPEKEIVHKKAIARQNNSEVPSIVNEVLNSPSQSLDNRTRTLMESRFGHDFSQVQIHTDAKAAESAQTIDAAAYTVGQNIVFGVDRYAPNTSIGRQLLAHELVHVMQSDSTRANMTSLPTRISDPTQASEREADRLSFSFRAGLPLPAPREKAVPSTLMPLLQTRQEDFYDPDFCYRPGIPRDSLHPDRTKVVAVMQAEIETPETCDGLVILRTSVLQSVWGADAPEFESYGGGEAQGISISLIKQGNDVHYEERFSLDNCHAQFSRCHMITFTEGGTKYTFAEAGYQPQVFAQSAPGGTVLHDTTPSPQLIVEPCDHVTPTLCPRQ